MKTKRLSLILVALIAVGGGLWLARSARRADPSSAVSQSSTDTLFKKPADGAQAGQMSPNPGRMLRPPDPTRRFREFTPEQRVEFARKGHGPGG